MNVYDKIRLVPFGEYIPLPFIFGFLRGHFEIANFSKGEIYTIFKIKDLNFGVLICFEDIFSDLVRNFVKRDADFMVNITNDAWFMKTSEPYQHLQASVFRAVENRINLVRAANTGISCFIDPYGRVINRVSSEAGGDTFIDGYKTQDIQIKKIRTFYTQFGDLFIAASFVSIVLSFVRSFSRETSSKI